MAEKKGKTPEEVSKMIVDAGGPQFAGTKAEANKFHDDKSLYTGVHGKGGPTTVDSVHPVASFGGPATAAPKAAAPKAAQATTAHAAASSLQEVFSHFAAGPEMDGKTLAKLAKDTKILDKKLSATDIDLIFAKVKDKTARKINYAQFEKAVHECATKKGVSFDDLSAVIMATGGPAFSGTKAEANKFHDDKSLYTGVHGKGGPSTKGDGIYDIS